MPAEKQPQSLSFPVFALALSWLIALFTLSLFQTHTLIFHPSPGYLVQAVGKSVIALPRFLVQVQPKVFWVLPLGLAAFGLGRTTLVRLFRLKAPAGVGLGFGLGLLSLVAFALAATGLTEPAAVQALLLLLAGWGLLELWFQLRPVRLTVRTVFRAEGLIAGVALMLGLVITFALFQPTFFYDALTFHLAMPQSYLLTGDVSPRPFITYSYFPQNLEMLYLLALAAGGVVPAQLVNALVWLALILSARDLGRELFGARAGAFSALALALLPCLSQAAILLSNDPAVALFGLTGLWFLARIQTEPGGKAFALWGASLGLAAGAKPTAYLFVLLPQGLAALFSRGRSLRGLLLAGAAGIALVSPWWIRNLVSIGNPLFPFFTSWFGGPLSARQGEILYGSTFVHLFSSSLLPFLLRLPAQMFLLEPAALDQALGSASLVGPFALLGLPFLFRRGQPRPTPARPVWLYLLWASLAWLATIHVMRLRYFLPGLAVAAVLSGAGIEVLLRPAVSGPRGSLLLKLLLSLLSLSLMLFLLSWALHLTHGFFCLRQPSPETDYLLRRSRDRVIELGAFPLIHELNQTLPANAQVLFVGETSFLYLQRPCLAPSFLNPNPLVHLVQQGLPFPVAARRLREAGLTHVLYRPAELDRLERDYRTHRLSAEQRARLEQFFQSGFCRPVAVQERPWALACELAPD